MDRLGGVEGTRDALDRVVADARMPNYARAAADLAAMELTTPDRPEDTPVDPAQVDQYLATLRENAGMYLFTNRRSPTAQKRAINEVLTQATPAELQAMMAQDPAIAEDLVRTFRMTDWNYAEMVGGYFGNEDMVSYWMNETPDVRGYAEIMRRPD